MQDGFGNEIDPILGYARGTILGDDSEFAGRRRHARRLMRARAQDGGRFHILTGNRADFLLQPNDLERGLAEGWVGPALWGDELATRAREHLGADEHHGVAMFNRTSAGIVAAISALAAWGGRVVSLVPAGRAHPCVRLGARFAGARIWEGPTLRDLGAELGAGGVSVAVITPVTSEQDAYDDAALRDVVESCRARGIPTLIDDAYGARVRPVLRGGARTFELHVDLAITNSDKAGLAGPRAGIMVGEPALVGRVEARGRELAQEAREPICLGVLRALERYAPEHLLHDAAGGQALGAALADRLGAAHVRQTLLGPTISEELVLGLLLERAGLKREGCGVVPAEATSAVCMLLLADHGIVTVNAAGDSATRPSLRLKPTADAVEALGGPEALAVIIVDAIDRVAAALPNRSALAAIILGEDAR